ncbi:MAG: hypothetical protein ACREMQ_23905 [Longimicrobiales bacterium]
MADLVVSSLEMVPVLCVAALSAWLLRGVVAVGVRPALRVLLLLVVVNLLLLAPVHAVGLANLIAGVPVRGTTILIAQLPLLLAALWTRRRTRSAAVTIPVSAPERVSAFVWISGCILLLSYLVFAIDSFTAFPDGWDGRYYHLPLALRWLQDESLRMPASLVWQFSIPANAELLMMLGIGTGVEQAATAFNLLSLAMIGTGVYLVARRLGAERDDALICSMIALSMPILTYQFFTAYVDAYAAAFLLAGLVLFLHREEPIWTRGVAEPRRTKEGRGTPPSALRSTAISDLLIGAVFGVAVGTKLTSLAYAGIGGGAMALALFASRGRSAALRFAGLVSVGFFATAGFWLWRAWSATGNPLYPLEIAVGDKVLLDGFQSSHMTPEDDWSLFVRSPADWLVYAWTEWHSSGYSFGTGQGFGAAFATFVPLGIVYLIVTTLRRRRRELGSALLAGFAAGVVVWWFMMHGIPRFAVPLLVLSCALTVPLLTRLRASAQQGLRVLVPLAIATTAIMTTSVPAINLARRARDGMPARASFYGLPAFVDSLPVGSRILNLAAKPYNYGLAGECLCYRIINSFEFWSPWPNAALAGANPDYVLVSIETEPRVRAALADAGFQLVRKNLVGSSRREVEMLARPAATATSRVRFHRDRLRSAT